MFVLQPPPIGLHAPTAAAPCAVLSILPLRFGSSSSSCGGGGLLSIASGENVNIARRIDLSQGKETPWYPQPSRGPPLRLGRGGGGGGGGGGGPAWGSGGSSINLPLLRAQTSQIIREKKAASPAAGFFDVSVERSCCCDERGVRSSLNSPQDKKRPPVGATVVAKTGIRIYTGIQVVVHGIVAVVIRASRLCGSNGCQPPSVRGTGWRPQRRRPSRRHPPLLLPATCAANRSRRIPPPPPPPRRGGQKTTPWEAAYVRRRQRAPPRSRSRFFGGR